MRGANIPRDVVDQRERNRSAKYEIPEHLWGIQRRSRLRRGAGHDAHTQFAWEEAHFFGLLLMDIYGGQHSSLIGPQ